MARSLPVVGLTTGLLLFASAIGVLAYLASGASQTEVTEHATVSINGTLRRAYPIPTGEDLRSEAAYSFAKGEGFALVVPCHDQGWATPDWTPTFLIERQGPSSSGLVVIDGSGSHDLTLSQPIAPIPPSHPSAGFHAMFFCSGRTLVFEWDNATTADPTVEVIVHETPLDGASASFAIGISVLGLLLAAVSGARAMRQPARPLPAETETTLESLVEALRLSTAWLERSRTHLLAAGILGIVVWYPVLLPWAWKTGASASSEPWGPWLMAGFFLLALLGATLFWGWRLVTLDRDLRNWRNRLEALRRREQELLADIEAS
jgi:hypothetical protein